MAAPRAIGVQNRVRVAGRGLLPLAVMAAVDRDGEETAIGQRPQQRQHRFLPVAGAVQGDDGRAGTGRAGDLDREAGHALFRFGREREVLLRKASAAAQRRRHRRRRHARAIDHAQEIGAGGAVVRILAGRGEREAQHHGGACQPETVARPLPHRDRVSGVSFAIAAA